MNPWVRTEEGHTPLLVVQINAHLSGFGVEWQTGQWQRVGRVLISVPQAERPEAVCRADGKFPLPVNRVPGQAEVPVCLVSYFHFPVMSTWEEGFLGHHVGHTVKPFGIFRDLLLLASVSDLLPVIRDGEVGVSRAMVQSELHCQIETRSAFQRKPPHKHFNYRKQLSHTNIPVYICSLFSSVKSHTAHSVTFNPSSNIPIFISLSPAHVYKSTYRSVDDSKPRNVHIQTLRHFINISTVKMTH